MSRRCLGFILLRDGRRDSLRLRYFANSNIAKPIPAERGEAKNSPISIQRHELRLVGLMNLSGFRRELVVSLNDLDNGMNQDYRAITFKYKPLCGRKVSNARSWIGS